MRNNVGLLRGLQYFEIVARLGSVKAAAGELGVTPGAVSRQLRELREAVGEQLITRFGRGIAVTPSGQRLAARLTEAFVNLERSIVDVVGGAKPLVRLAVCTSFGPGWLAARLHGFYAANPDYELEMRLYTLDPTQTDQVADAIVTAQPVAPGYQAVRLFDETLVAVHRPGGVGRGNGQMRLITTTLSPGEEGREWNDFARLTGRSLAEFQPASFLRASHYLLAVEMAKAGLGVALVPDFLAARDLASGAIVLFDERHMPAGRTYHLCFKSSRAREPGLSALAGWLRAQANHYARNHRTP